MSTQYDTILIGTSPICVLEACALKAMGRVPLLIDRARAIGGAWSSVEVPPVGIVESGPHSLSFTPSTRDFVCRTLGVELAPMVPAPIFVLPQRIFGSYRASYQKRWPYAVRRIESRFPWSAAACNQLVTPYYHYLRNLLNTAPRFANAIENVVGGTPVIAKRLEELARIHRLDVLLATDVDSVSIDSKAGRVSVRTTAAIHSAGELIMTARTVLDSIELDGEHCSLASAEVPLVQLLLVWKDAAPFSFSFAHFIDSPNVWLASDLTSSISAEARGQGYRVVGLVVTHDVVPGDDALARIVAELRARGLIEMTATLAAHRWVPFNGPNRSSEELAAIEARFKPFVRTLQSDGFSQSIEINAPRWAQWLTGDQRSVRTPEAAS